MPINYASPQPAHTPDPADRIAHLIAERDEARQERDELGRLLEDIAEVAHDGVENQRTPWGACYTIDRVLRDQAPARYRERLT